MTTTAHARGYSDKVLMHYRQPRNVGSLDEDNAHVGTGWVGGREQGEIIRLQIKVDQSGIIEDTRFKTYGCGSAIAASSLVSEWLKGKTLGQALAIDYTQIAQELSLPTVKLHCAMLAQDAIAAAVRNYQDKQG